MKKKIIILLTIIFIFNIGIVYADDGEEEEYNSNEIENLVVESSAKVVKEPQINGRAAVIYDRSTNEIIWGKNENQKRPMASTTKIMTAIVVIENSNLNDEVCVSKKAALTGGSRLKLNTNDKISVKNLLYGLMLRSRK